MVSLDSDAGTTRPNHLWSLREDVLVEDDPEENRIVVVTKWAEFTIDDVADVVRSSLRRMSLGPISLENVVAGSRPAGRDPEGPREQGRPDANRYEWDKLREALDLLSGSVVRSLGLGDGDTPLLSAVPVARSASLTVTDVRPDQAIRLSRFAAIRSAEGDLLLESPLGQYHVVLLRQVAARVVTALGRATTIDEVVAELGIPRAVVAAIVGYLAGTAIVQVGDSRPPSRATFAEDSDPVLLQWSHHDLLFHARSRMGRHGGESGAVFPLADRLPGPDLVKRIPSATRLALSRPGIDDLIRADPTLTDVLEHAKLCDNLTDRQLTAEQVGELLYRTARIRSVASSSGAGVRYDISDRPYLSVHGLYELEVYVSAHRCAGVPRGTYHYDPRQHELVLVNDSQPELDELLDRARVAARTSLKPPLLITLTARVARSSWMYGGIGYSLALIHVGALLQTLCLVANAMGLAACAPAVDPGDGTEHALRLEWPAEVGVGEFLVG